MSEAPLGAESNGGGGGIRTRVRKHIPAGIYDAYPLLKRVAPDVKKQRRTARSQPRKSLAADVRDGRQQPACLNDIQSRPAG